MKKCQPVACALSFSASSTSPLSCLSLAHLRCFVLIQHPTGSTSTTNTMVPIPIKLKSHEKYLDYFQQVQSWPSLVDFGFNPETYQDVKRWRNMQLLPAAVDYMSNPWYCDRRLGNIGRYHHLWYRT